MKKSIKLKFLKRAKLNTINKDSTVYAGNQSMCFLHTCNPLTLAQAFKEKRKPISEILGCTSI